jgi:hypothetical protein
MDSKLRHIAKLVASGSWKVNDEEVTVTLESIAFIQEELSFS